MEVSGISSRKRMLKKSALEADCHTAFCRPSAVDPCCKCQNSECPRTLLPRNRNDEPASDVVAENFRARRKMMFKFIGGTIGIIFLIGLLVVIGLLKLIF